MKLIERIFGARPPVAAQPELIDELRALRASVDRFNEQVIAHGRIFRHWDSSGLPKVRGSGTLPCA